MTEVTPIPKAPRAKKRREPMPQEAVEAVHQRSRGWCECSPECTDTAQEIHHKRRRSQGGTNDLDNLVALSRRHHARVHANPSWAYSVGLLVRTTAEVKP